MLTADRPGLVEEESASGNVTKCTGNINLPGFFWDDEQKVPKYKWEGLKALRMQHRRVSPRFNVPEASKLTWQQLATDSPGLAPNGDWTPIGGSILRLRAALIDGSPGTGKTSLIRTLIKIVTREYGEDGFLALAPTNVAARNLGEMGYSIKTIAAFQRQWQDAHERGGKAMQRLIERMVHVRYLFVDEISMMHSWYYGLFHSVRRMFPVIRMFFIGDFKQLAPVCDVWDGDYAASSALHHLCDGHRLHLSHCRRSDDTLFRMYMDDDYRSLPGRLPVTELTRLHLAYLHHTRIDENARCMEAFSQGAATKVVPKDPQDPKSQDITLFEGMPLVCYKTKKEKGHVVLAHSEIWLVAELGDDDKVTLLRKVEEVDRDAGKSQEEMPTLDMAYGELQGRFRPGYCITVHMSQGKTFRERYTIHNWDFKHMVGRGQYVALSRGKSANLVQIAATRNADHDDCDADDDDWDGEDDDDDWDGEEE